MADMNIFRYVSKLEMEDMVWKNNMTFKEISDQLQGENPGVTGLSERSVRRYCTENNIRKRSIATSEQRERVIMQEATKVNIS